ncbi:MAG: histidine kinase [Actinomycetota bacterium]|nr:histidine kinase [Actinomycetota bacterium]
MNGKQTWIRRLQITSHVLHVATFTIAVGGALLITGVTTRTLVAGGVALVGVLLGLTLRIPFQGPAWRFALPLGGGIALYTVAILLTGGITSTFTLLPVATIFLAAAGGRLRYALPATAASIAGVIGTAAVAGIFDDPTALIRIPAVYAIIAVAFSEIQEALTSETKRAQALLLAMDTVQSRRARLTATHSLLSDLVEVAQSRDINAVTTAQDAIRDVGLIVGDAPCRIVTMEDVVLARRGTTPDGPAERRLPITFGGVRIAHLDIWEGSIDLDEAEVAAVALAIEPVGLAIDNDALVQRLAGITIQHERVRLARELHDDVAPTIAAVGLTLDMALMSGNLDDEQTRNLSAARSNISRLVDQIRLQVQDLRADRSTSIVEMAHALVADVDTEGPTVIVDIDEQTPPRPAIAAEIGAFMAEGFRNALQHADATAIWITGSITESGGLLAVKDNGSGFDDTTSVDGHFGLVGMRERAAILTATFELDTKIGEGTVVALRWEDAP